MSFKHMTYADWTYVADISFITYIVIIICFLAKRLLTNELTVYLQNCVNEMATCMDNW